MTIAPADPLPPPGRLPLRRPPRPYRLLTGTAAGVALHLGVPVAWTRLVFLALIAMGGIGAPLYLVLWVCVPAGDPVAEAAGLIPPAQARLASRLEAASPEALGPRTRALLGAAGLGAAAVVVAVGGASGLDRSGWLVPAAMALGGAALAWSQIDAVASGSRQAGHLARLCGGVVLAALGILLGTGVWLGLDVSGTIAVKLLVVGVVLAAGVALLLAPLWLRIMRATTLARQSEARQAERADIAAHLHDSVLQTLTLIRRRAAEPQTVARLARAQERELRAWLYTDRAQVGTSVAEELREVVAEAEDRYGHDIDLVIVGDTTPTPSSAALVAASREAVANAVRHGAPPVSVYAECGAATIDVFVRDRGPGFCLEDLAAVPADRHGVRESILARLERSGGSARWRRLEKGTEVHLMLTAPPAAAQQPAGQAPADPRPGSVPESTLHHPPRTPPTQDLP